MLLAEILSNGDASRLHRALVQDKRLVTDVSAYLGTFGDPLEERDPTRLTITAHYADRDATDKVVAAVDAELDRLATDGTEPGELRRAGVQLAATISQELDSVLNRCLEFAQVPADLRRRRADPAAARRCWPRSPTTTSAPPPRALAPTSRAVVELVPGAAK